MRAEPAGERLVGTFSEVGLRVEVPAWHGFSWPFAVHPVMDPLTAGVRFASLSSLSGTAILGSRLACSAQSWRAF